MYVLDTNVLMHDPACLFAFKEHDVCVPVVTLEELDNHKGGHSEPARNARQTSRNLDEIVSGFHGDMRDGIPLQTERYMSATGRLYLYTDVPKALPASFAKGIADNQILAVVKHLRNECEKDAILVSKDMNMRIKAHALGIPAEDYRSDMVLEDTDVLYTGTRILTSEEWAQIGNGMDSRKRNGHDIYSVYDVLAQSFHLNQFLCLEDDGTGRPLYLRVECRDGERTTLSTLTDYTSDKNAVWGITARNPEQNYALNLLMNPRIDFVTLGGQAGTGKTLLTLAAGLHMTLEQGRLFSEIIMTRATVPVGEDIGFLPGTEEEKMGPWMGALDDNLEVLNGWNPKKCDEDKGSWERAVTRDLIRNNIKIKSLNFMRGRTFLKKFLIIDEAQNLTPKQMKTLITRAGPYTKIVCLGNIAQIDTPYLSEGSSGLTHVVDRFKGWQHAGHVTLLRGERSRLADHAAEVL